ncbi:MAG: DNA polymerase-4 [Oleiphilaceae bacterium]|jgi:DNA polymerase-4
MTNTKQRKIIHIDADAFYASVEVRDNPQLALKPIAVGGQPSRRGVIATCNYIARKHGIHSAMASSHAIRLCPNLIIVPPNFKRYKQVSAQIRDIMLRYTDIIEPLSLDEAYLDVTDAEHFNGSATRIAEAIKKAVSHELSIQVSAGVAPNKFLAKIASDWEKPDGLFVITPSQVEVFVLKLPVNKINGVGKVTTQKLNNLGIHTCGDLQGLGIHTLSEKFGKYGIRLHELSYGTDLRPVQTSRTRKSLSVEHTFSKDLHSEDDIEEKFHKLYQELCDRATKLEPEAKFNKRFVKVKFSDFTQTTLEESFNIATDTWDQPQEFTRMLVQAWRRNEKPVRLLGLGLKLLTPAQSSNLMQMNLFSDLDFQARSDCN